MWASRRRVHRPQPTKQQNPNNIRNNVQTKKKKKKNENTKTYEDSSSDSNPKHPPFRRTNVESTKNPTNSSRNEIGNSDGIDLPSTLTSLPFDDGGIHASL
mmetsp:Transcript_8971/g.18053  ORF Transcript_8971/g.18053 Transcript_8971/m.18053 type:complete len:101 (+) Transcript_8971:497-799(+)